MVEEAKAQNDPVARYIQRLNLENNTITMTLTDPWAESESDSEEEVGRAEDLTEVREQGYARDKSATRVVGTSWRAAPLTRRPAVRTAMLPALTTICMSQEEEEESSRKKKKQKRAKKQGSKAKKQQRDPSKERTMAVEVDLGLSSYANATKVSVFGTILSQAVACLLCGSLAFPSCCLTVLVLHF